MIAPYLRHGLAAGLLAGLLAGLFVFVAGEPLLDRAIDPEGQAPAHEGDGEAVIGRTTEKVGLFFATGLSGLFIGGLFGLTFAFSLKSLRSSSLRSSRESRVESRESRDASSWAARFAGCLAMLAVLFAALVGCGGPPAAGPGPDGKEGGGFPVVVEDDVGRRVEISSRPDRIGSMAPSVTETLFAIGAGERVAGVTTADDYPEQVKGLEKIGNYQTPNVEKMLTLDIDLLFVSFDSATAEAAEDLEDQTKTDVVVINPKTVEGTVESVSLVGRTVDERAGARELRTSLEKDLAAVERSVAGRPTTTVFYEVWDDPLQTVGPGSFVHDAIGLAGGENVAADTGEAYPTYSEETLLKKDPDYYLVSETTPGEVASRPAYSALAAVEKEQVTVVDADLIARPGPRLVEGVREIAEAIHPEAFARESS